MSGDPTLDVSVFDGVLRDRTDDPAAAVEAFTHSGGTAAMWCASAVLVVALALVRRRGDAVLVGGAMFTGLVLMSALKRLWRRERPPIPERLVDVDSYSFPSGHAMMTAIFAVTVGFVVVTSVGPRVLEATLAALLVVFTLGIGLSRVYLAAHWATDVAAGWLFGVVWGAVWIVARRSAWRVAWPRRHRPR
ncbi:phosphatase PAP2 family protein [Rhodococcus sp. HNM0569]|uniref:phosphatase PAP2 family protein n=1 Tax=Rhodococcus sp. HNM0569 TaxID=2716340 RepID=UPI003211D296